MNLNEFNFMTFARPKRHPTPRISIIVTFGRIGIKRKKTSMFLSIIEATNENGKIIMDAMDRINTNQVQIDKNGTKFHEITFKQHFKYLRGGDEGLQDEQESSKHSIKPQLCNVDECIVQWLKYGKIYTPYNSIQSP
jgi:hypothetical protein